MMVKYLKICIVSLILLSTPYIAAAENNTTEAANISINATGVLKVITVPVDGGIYIDNQPVGSGLYYNTSFPAGIYRISFGAVEGYESPKNQTAAVSAGSQANIIAQYATRAITPPDVTISKEASSASIAVDEVVNIIIKIKNKGDIKAFSVSVNDSVPECALLEGGETAWSGDLESGESRLLSYSVRPARGGLCIFAPSRATFGDSSGNKFSRFSDEVKVTISPKPASEPHLTVEKGVDKSTALVDEGAVITLKVKNDGSAKALNVTLADYVPDCAFISQGKNSWNGELQPDEEKVITYIIGFSRAGLCSLDAAKASYSNANGNNYIKYSEQLNIYVKEKSMSELLDAIVKPVVIIGTAIGSLLTIITVYRSIRSKIPEKKEEKKEEKQQNN